MDNTHEKINAPPFESKLETIGETSGNSSLNDVPSMDEKDDAVTGNPVIDQYDLEDLIARRDLMYEVRTRKAYLKRYRALEKVFAQKRTDMLITKRRRFNQNKSKARQETRTGGIFTESALIVP